MKPISKFSNFLFLLGSLSILSSCHKNDKPTPCDHPIKVIACDPSMYNFGHFMIEGDQTSSFAASTTYLKASNWSKFSTKIVPGKSYLLGFKYVECKDDTYGWCGTELRCGTPVLKCIEILCVKEAPLPQCNDITLFPDNFSNYYSRALNGASISGNTLTTTAYFSACSQNDPVGFTLYMNQVLTSEQGQRFRYVAKVAELNSGFTCQAVFQKQTCFDLSGLFENFKKNNQAIPDEVSIQLYLGDSSINLIYHPIK